MVTFQSLAKKLAKKLARQEQEFQEKTIQQYPSAYASVLREELGRIHLKPKSKERPIKTAKYTEIRYLERDLKSRGILNPADLKQHGYEQLYDPGFGKGRGELVWVRPGPRESAEHTCMVYNVAQEIKKLAGKKEVTVTTPMTKEADVIATLKSKKFAFEVETGTSKDQEIQDKIKRHTQKFGQNWCFVLIKTAKVDQVELLKNIRRYKQYYQNTIGRQEVPRFIKKLLKW